MVRNYVGDNRENTYFLVKFSLKSKQTEQRKYIITYITATERHK